MPAHDDSQAGALATAADQLAAELHRFHELADALDRERLNSEKALKRAIHRLQQLADCDARLAGYVQTLVAAIGAARERQEAQARSVQTRATEIQTRSQALLLLRERCDALHAQAVEVNARAQQLLQDQNGGTDERVRLRAALEEIGARLHAIAGSAETLVQAAHADDFIDIARDAESLRAQLTATRNKLELLQRRLG